MDCLVLLSSYNGEKYIGEQIESIFGQKDVGEMKVLIRDDGSTDNTIGIINDYIKKGFDIELVKGTNLGFVGSFINLIDLASEYENNFDYFLLSDQDDVWLEDKVSTGVHCLENKDYLLYCSSSTPVNEQLSPLKHKHKRFKVDPYSAVIQNFSPGHTFIFRKELLDLAKNADASKIYAHDSFLFSLACMVGSVVYDEVPHTLYRQYSNNQIGTSNKSLIRYIRDRLSRLKRGDFKKYGSQIRFINERYGHLFDPSLRNEIDRFLNMQRSFFSRFRFVCGTKMHRQTLFDNILFKLAYLMGEYNSKS